MQALDLDATILCDGSGVGLDSDSLRSDFGVINSERRVLRNIMRFNGKTVLVTGAARGIGLAIAQAFAEEGASVLMTDCSAEKLKAEAEKINKSGGKAWYHPMDVSNDKSVEDAVKAALSDSNKIDVVINNAGVAYQGYFWELDFNQPRHEMEVNFFGMLRVIRLILPTMIERRQGTIINISSVVGTVPYPTQATYSATKAAIIAFSEALQGEVEPYGVRIVIVIPGLADTDMGRSLKMVGVPPPQKLEDIAKVVLKAAEKGRGQIVCGFSNQIAILIARLFPQIAKRNMANIAKASMRET